MRQRWIRPGRLGFGKNKGCAFEKAGEYAMNGTVPMATYVYETIPQKPGEKPRQFEVQQSMKDPALTHCPTTGKPVRRVLVGGSIITRGTSILSMNKPKRRG